MGLRPWFEWLDALPSSVALRESLYGYAILLTAHVGGMALFAGLICMMDLRLVGAAYRQTPVSQIQKRLFPWQMVGMGIAAVTGVLLFYGQPMRYYGRVFFWVKVFLMILAGVNALYFHLTTYQSVSTWDRDARLPKAAKMAGVFGLFLWAGVVIFGRLTAYNWFVYE